MLGEYWHQGWNELRELYWAIAAVCYVVVMRDRLLSGHTMSQSRSGIEQHGRDSTKIAA
jgi:hypothetical protein